MESEEFYCSYKQKVLRFYVLRFYVLRFYYGNNS